MTNTLITRLLVFLLTTPAWGTMLFTSGPINGTIGNDSFITPPWSLSEPFTIVSSSFVTDLSNMGIEVINTTTFATLNWTISTGADGTGTVEASATNVGPSTSTAFGTFGNFNIFNMSFSVPSVLLTPGTYYLTLSNGVSACNPNCSSQAANSAYWDEVNKTTGTGATYFNGGQDSTNLSWSFEVDGSSASGVPEPGSMMLLGAGLAALWIKKRRYINPTRCSNSTMRGSF